MIQDVNKKERPSSDPSLYHRFTSLVHPTLLQLITSNKALLLNCIFSSEITKSTPFFLYFGPLENVFPPPPPFFPENFWRKDSALRYWQSLWFFKPKKEIKSPFYVADKVRVLNCLQCASPLISIIEYLIII